MSRIKEGERGHTVSADTIRALHAAETPDHLKHHLNGRRLGTPEAFREHGKLHDLTDPRSRGALILGVPYTERSNFSIHEVVGDRGDGSVIVSGLGGTGKTESEMETNLKHYDGSRAAATSKTGLIENGADILREMGDDEPFYVFDPTGFLKNKHPYLAAKLKLVTWSPLDGPGGIDWAKHQASLLVGTSEQGHDNGSFKRFWDSWAERVVGPVIELARTADNATMRRMGARSQIEVFSRLSSVDEDNLRTCRALLSDKKDDLTGKSRALIWYSFAGKSADEIAATIQKRGAPQWWYTDATPELVDEESRLQAPWEGVPMADPYTAVTAQFVTKAAEFEEKITEADKLKTDRKDKQKELTTAEEMEGDTVDNLTKEVTKIEEDIRKAEAERWQLHGEVAQLRDIRELLRSGGTLSTDEALNLEYRDHKESDSLEKQIRGLRAASTDLKGQDTKQISTVRQMVEDIIGAWGNAETQMSAETERGGNRFDPEKFLRDGGVVISFLPLGQGKEFGAIVNTFLSKITDTTIKINQSGSRLRRLPLIGIDELTGAPIDKFAELMTGIRGYGRFMTLVQGRDLLGIGREAKEAITAQLNHAIRITLPQNLGTAELEDLSDLYGTHMVADTSSSRSIGDSPLSGGSNSTVGWRKEKVKEAWELNKMPWHTGNIHNGPLVEDIAFKRSTDYGLDQAIILKATPRILEETARPGQSQAEMNDSLDRVSLATGIVNRELAILQSGGESNGFQIYRGRAGLTREDAQRNLETYLPELHGIILNGISDIVGEGERNMHEAGVKGRDKDVSELRYSLRRVATAAGVVREELVGLRSGREVSRGLTALMERQGLTPQEAQHYLEERLPELCSLGEQTAYVLNGEQLTTFVLNTDDIDPELLSLLRQDLPNDKLTPQREAAGGKRSRRSRWPGLNHSTPDVVTPGEDLHAAAPELEENGHDEPAPAAEPIGGQDSLAQALLSFGHILEERNNAVQSETEPTAIPRTQHEGRREPARAEVEGGQRVDLFEREVTPLPARVGAESGDPDTALNSTENETTAIESAQAKVQQFIDARPEDDEYANLAMTALKHTADAHKLEDTFTDLSREIRTAGRAGERERARELKAQRDNVEEKISDLDDEHAQLAQQHPEYETIRTDANTLYTQIKTDLISAEEDKNSIDRVITHDDTRTRESGQVENEHPKASELSEPAADDQRVSALNAPRGQAEPTETYPPVEVQRDSKEQVYPPIQKPQIVPGPAPELGPAQENSEQKIAEPVHTQDPKELDRSEPVQEPEALQKVEHDQPADRQEPASAPVTTKHNEAPAPEVAPPHDNRPDQQQADPQVEPDRQEPEAPQKVEHDQPAPAPASAPALEPAQSYPSEPIPQPVNAQPDSSPATEPDITK